MSLYYYVLLTYDQNFRMKAKKKSVFVYMFMYVCIYVCMLYTGDNFLSPGGIIKLIYKIPQMSSSLIGLEISGHLHNSQK